MSHQHGPQDGQRVHTSASDREAVARRLATAASEGQLSARELERRLTRTHEAHTYEQLEQLLEDLTGTQQPAERTVPEHTVPETLQISASLRDVHRRGQWRVPSWILACSGRGTVTLDFTEAIVTDDVVTVDARPNWNDVRLIVPEGYAVSEEQVIPGAEPILNRTTAEPRPDLPRLHIIANPGLGSIIVSHPRRKGWFRRALRQKAA